MNTSEYGPRRGLKILKVIGMIIAGMAFAVIFALAFGLAVQYLWNWLMPDLFGLKVITYWQAFALVILAKIFFGGFGKHHGGHGGGCDKRPWHGLKHRRLNGFPPRHDWKYFEGYWQEEGKTAYEEYVKRMESADKGKD
jgi:hypothetical protein